MTGQNRTYLDWNATAPLRPEARAAMLGALDATGNPSSVHGEGRAARRLIEDARDQVAALVGARPPDVIFTSGATEANNTVIRSGWLSVFAADIEHDSVLAPLRAADVLHAQLPVGADGVVGLGQLDERLGQSADTAHATLVTLQLANNETGVLQPVSALAAIARAHGVRVHSDVTQAIGRIAVDMSALGVDYVSLSSHKIGGPKGAGALVVREGAPVSPLITGGGQERRYRAGTENVAAIAGFGAAARAVMAVAADMPRVAALRCRLEANVISATPGARIIGHEVLRLANTSCIALPGRSAEMLVTALDLAGIAVSAGAACSSGKIAASHVLTAMGLGLEIARSAIRISIGPTTTDDDITAFLAAWTNITRHLAKAA